VGVVTVEAGGDASVELESAEAAFDAITLCIELLVVPVLVFARAFGWNNRLHPPGSNEGTNLVGIITLVGNHRLGGLSRQQRCGALAVGLLAAG